jgi:putative hydrolase of the HAD superfamily
LSPYEALVFDLGGVIVAHDNAVLYARLASRCDRGWSVDDVQAIVGLPRWATGAGSISELHACLGDNAGYAADWDTFVEDWCCHFTIDASMLAFLQELRRNHRVMLFSNTNKEHWDYLDGLTQGVLKTFEAYLSHEIGLAKPAVASFEHVARAAGVEASRCIFFDDVLENVEGARRAGFNAEVFTSEAELRRRLKDRGVHR